MNQKFGKNKDKQSFLKPISLLTDKKKPLNPGFRSVTSCIGNFT